MKAKMAIKALVLTICIIGFNQAQAQVEVEASITKVTVYPQRAMITRSATLILPAGDHTLFVKNLPNRADENSFRASAQGEIAILLGLNHHVVRHTEMPQKKAAELDQKIYLMEEYERKGILDRKEIFDQQKKMLLSIGFKSGEEMSEQLDKGGLEISQWRDAFDFVGETLRAINDSTSVVNRELHEVDLQLSKLREDRRAIAGQLSRQSKTVEIDMRMTKAGQVSIDLDYVIGGVSWKPLYDARLDDKSEKIALNCFGEVRQTTGEDWNDIDLVLSTSEPAKGTGPGDLIPWILSLYADVPSPVDELLQRETGLTLDADGSILHIRGGRSGETTHLVDGVNFSDPLGGIVKSAFSTSFVVTRKVSVPSGEDAVRVPIGNHSLDRKIEFVCRPKNRQAVYRLATITNQPDSPLLPGPVTIFAGSDYLGNTFLARFVAPGDEFDLPFGQDNYIEVDREITENKTTHKSDKIRNDQTIKVTLANHSLDSRKIEVEESLPVPQDSRIKVKLKIIQPEKDRRDGDDKGQAIWTISLNPGEEKEIILSYQIEYPTGMHLTGF